MKFVILSTYYQSGHASANGICARELCASLRAKGNQVKVICYSINYNKDNDDNIIEIPEKSIERSKRRITSYIDTFKSLYKPSIDKKLVKDYHNVLLKISETEIVNVIVAMYFPVEAIVAAIEFKLTNPNTKLIAFELDSVGDGISNGSWLDCRKAMAFERYLDLLYPKIDSIIVMNSHANFWKYTHCSSINKMKVSDIPMFVPSHSESENCQKEKKNKICLYTGLLDRKYRNPFYYITLMSQLNSDFVLLETHFYSKGDCEDELKQLANQCEYITTHGYVDKPTLDEASKDADILLSIGNSNSNSLPSKLIVYMATGKPILHIASNCKDICLEYLDKYPRALVLQENDDFKVNLNKLEAFIKNDDTNVDYTILKRALIKNTPDYSAELITSV